MAPSLEEVIYDLARAALDEQREVVANLRSRAAPVLAGAGALAALLARPAIDDGLSFVQHPAHVGATALAADHHHVDPRPVQRARVDRRCGSPYGLASATTGAHPIRRPGRSLSAPAYGLVLRSPVAPMSR